MNSEGSFLSRILCSFLLGGRSMGNHQTKNKRLPVSPECNSLANGCFKGAVVQPKQAWAVYQTAVPSKSEIIIRDKEPKEKVLLPVPDLVRGENIPFNNAECEEKALLPISLGEMDGTNFLTNPLIHIPVETLVESKIEVEEEHVSDRLECDTETEILLTDEAWTSLVNQELPSLDLVESVKIKPQKPSYNPCFPEFEAEGFGTFSDLMICPVCQMEYCTETGDPRLLVGCGHYLCSKCFMRLAQVYNYEFFDCPVCKITTNLKEYENGEEVQDYKYVLCQTLKSTIYRYKERKARLKSAMPKDITSVLPFSENYIGTCESHNLPIHFGCVTCMSVSCSSCILENHLESNLQCQVFKINEALLRMKMKLIDEVRQRREAIKKRKNDLLKLLKSIKEVKNCCSSNHAKGDKKEITKERKKFKNHVQILNIKIPKLLTSKEELVKAETASEIFKCIESSSKLRIFNSNYISKRAFFSWSSRVSYNRNENMLSLKIRKKGMFIGSSSGMLTLKENRFLLRIDHDIMYDSCPDVDKMFYDLPNAAFVPYIIIRCMDNYCHPVKLKFEVDNTILGSAFLMRCCSICDTENFTGTLVEKPLVRSKSIVFGECLGSTDDIYSSLFAGIQYDRKKSSIYNKLLDRGFIGLYNSPNNTNFNAPYTIFYINMDDSASINLTVPFYNTGTKNLTNCFGLVLEGLDELELMMKNCKEILYISECGIEMEN